MSNNSNNNIHKDITLRLNNNNTTLDIHCVCNVYTMCIQCVYNVYTLHEHCIHSRMLAVCKHVVWILLSLIHRDITLRLNNNSVQHSLQSELTLKKKIAEQREWSFFETLVIWFSLAFYGMVSYNSVWIIRNTLQSFSTCPCNFTAWIVKSIGTFKKSFKWFDKNFVTVTMIYESTF